MALTLSWGSNRVTSAANPVIGTAAANGGFRVNNMNVNGNATVFEGGTVETNSVPSTLHLSSGTKMTLGADSKGRVFGDHIVLERGQGNLENPSGFHLEAKGLTIQPETGRSAGKIRLTGGDQVLVAAATGSFRVLNASGLLVAKVSPGTPLSFNPRGASTLTRVKGRLSLRGGHVLLTDETTQVTVEAMGSEVENNIGKRVEITATIDPAVTPASDASALVRVSRLTVLAQNGAGNPQPTPNAGSGAGAGADSTAAAGTAAGSTAAGTAWIGVGTVAIIGGVAAAVTVGGLAAAGAFQDEAASMSR